jgi:hypothetical protein
MKLYSSLGFAPRPGLNGARERALRAAAGNVGQQQIGEECRVGTWRSGLNREAYEQTLSNHSPPDCALDAREAQANLLQRSDALHDQSGLLEQLRCSRVEGSHVLV